MKGYKGFSKGLVCRGKQYAENTVYEEDEAVMCEKGMHFCANPFDVWRFYPPTDKHGNLNEFAEVEAEEAKTDDNIKFVTKKLKIGAKLSLPEFVKAGVEFVSEKTEGNPATNTGSCSAATNTGDCSAATNTGDWSAATNTGDCSAASVLGDESIAIVTGRDSKAKGAVGCWIVLTERDSNWHILSVKAIKVDGEIIKADTWYTLKDGEVKKVEEAE